MKSFNAREISSLEEKDLIKKLREGTRVTLMKDFDTVDGGFIIDDNSNISH